MVHYVWLFVAVFLPLGTAFEYAPHGQYLLVAQTDMAVSDKPELLIPEEAVTPVEEGKPVPTLTSVTTPEDLTKLILDAAKSRNWMLLIALGLIALVFMVRTYGVERVERLKWFKTDRGGTVLVLVLAMAVSVANSLLGGAEPSVQVLLDGAYFGMLAIGGFVGFRKLVNPSDKKGQPDVEETTSGDE